MSPQHIQDDESFAARLDEARQRAGLDQPDETPLHGPANGKREGLGLVIRVISEMIGGVVVGVLIGYWLDQWLDTSPLLLIIFFFLGSVTGMYTVYKSVSVGKR